MAKRSEFLTNALSYLITSQPFIAVLLMELLEIVEVPKGHKVERAATDNKHIFINTDWASKLTVHELTFVIAHEVLHVIYQHIPRGKTYADRGLGPDFKRYSHTRMNKATDYVINGTLTESKIGKMPLEGLHNPSIGSKDNADDVYCQLPYEEDDPNQQGPSGFDEHLPPVAGDQPTQGDIQRAVSAAAAAAKAQGNLSGGLARLAGEILEPEQDWRELLRDFMVTAMGHDEPTWSRLNRRKLAVAPHVAFPGTQGLQSGNVAIVVDTSGSISDKELSCFLSEISGIMEQAHPRECKLFWCDTHVPEDGIDEIDEYTNMADLKPKGGGGTDMEAAFPTVDEEFMGDVDCCIVLTDMYTSFHEKNKPDYPVLWCSTTEEKESPYGQTIYMKVAA